MFTGFPFGHDHPFTYPEGKRVLELAMGELRSRRDLQDQLGMNPASGRKAIRGSKANEVWDFLSLSTAKEGKKSTNNPHLTLVVSWQAVEALVIVPHAVNKVVRQKLIDLGKDGFREQAEDVVDCLKQKKLLRDHGGATPWFRGHQRHSLPRARGAPLVVDAIIEGDLRTAIPSGGPIKTQPRWLFAAYGLFVDKENSNYEMQMGVQFRYERCPELQQANAIGLIASAWLGCKPLIDLAR
jgi:hypothetical protein